MRFVAVILVCSALHLSWSQSPAFQPAEQTGTISGQILDPMGAVIAKATIGVLDAQSRRTVQIVRSDSDGRFRANGLAAGEYLLAASAPGFREKLLSIGELKAGGDTVLTIRLDVLDCDAPGVNCDIFSTGPVTDPHPIVARGPLTVRRGDAVDLEHGIVAAQPADADVRLAAQAEGLFLVPLNKALIYQECGTEGACGKGHATLESARIDGLGPGSEFCIKTRRRQCSKVFLTKQVDPGADEAAISIVTRAK